MWSNMVAMSHNDNVNNCNKINIWFFFHAKNLEAECCKWSRYWVTQMIASLPVQKVWTVLLWLRALTVSYIHMAVTFTMQEQKQALTSFGFRNSQGTVWKALTEGGRDCREESRGFGFCSERLGEAGMWWVEEKGGETHILNVSVALCWVQKTSHIRVQFLGSPQMKTMAWMGWGGLCILNTTWGNEETGMCPKLPCTQKQTNKSHKLTVLTWRLQDLLGWAICI